MLLQFIVILLVIMAFMEETLSATTKSTPKSTPKSTLKSTTQSTTKSKSVKATITVPIASCDCSAAYDAIHDCIDKPAQSKSNDLYYCYFDFYDMKSVLKLLEKLKKKGCIKASAWPNIQAWLLLNTPPEPLANIYNELTKKQKKTLKKYYSKWADKKIKKQYDTICKKIEKQKSKLSKADRKMIDDWETRNSEICEYPEYSSSSYYQSSSSYYNSYGIYSDYY